MSFVEAIQTCFSKYANFHGRALRSEFWYFVLFLLLAGTCVGAIDLLAFGTRDGAGPLALIFTLATLLPNIAVSVRRLHDHNKSGWLLLLVLIPFVGAVLLIVWWCQRGDEGPNRFGPPQLVAPGR